jgi:hypothetical protein
MSDNLAITLCGAARHGAARTFCLFIKPRWFV